MLTRAAEQIFQSWFVGNGRNDSYSVVPIFPNEPIKDTSGGDRYLSHVYSTYLWNYYVYTDSNISSSGIRLGTGLTAPTKYDYCMERQITSDVTAAMTGSYKGVDNGVPYINFTLTCTNNSSSNLTISEIGYINDDIYAFDDPTASYNTCRWRPFLLDRTLLDNPITVGPTETAAIKYTIKCDMSFA